MLVGVPKEIKDNEYRVAIVPSTVRELADKGHRVIVERQDLRIAIIRLQAPRLYGDLIRIKDGDAEKVVNTTEIADVSR